MINPYSFSFITLKLLTVCLLISALDAQADAALENSHVLANGGDSSAQLRLANAYYSGKNGVERNCEQAIYLYSRAASNQQDIGVVMPVIVQANSLC
jgi:TPR repeat protein